MPRAHSKAALPSVFLAVTLLTWSCFQYAFAHAGFLGVVVMPTANYVSEGIALTVSGFNFINLGEHRVLVQAETVPREFYQDGLDTIACLFAQSSHGKPISSATVIGEHSVACVLPLTLRPGFVSVGVSTNGIDSFFHSEVTVSVRARPELYHVIGSRIQSGGDHAHVIGDGLEPRQAHSALPGHALLCGWHTPIGINSRNEKVSLGAELERARRAAHALDGGTDAPGDGASIGRQIQSSNHPSHPDDDDDDAPVVVLPEDLEFGDDGWSRGGGGALDRVRSGDLAVPRNAALEREISESAARAVEREDAEAFDREAAQAAAAQLAERDAARRRKLAAALAERRDVAAAGEGPAMSADSTHGKKKRTRKGLKKAHLLVSFGGDDDDEDASLGA